MPSTPELNLPFEVLSDQPGITLHGGLSGTNPILAERTEEEILDIQNSLQSNIQQVADGLSDLEQLFLTTGVQVIDTIDTGAGTNTTEFVDIPQTFRALMIVWSGSSNGSGQVDSLALRFNGDSGSNYLSRLSRNDSSDAFTSSNSGMGLTFTVLRAGHVGTDRSSGSVLIPAYADDSENTYVYGSTASIGQSDPDGGDIFTTWAAGFWNNTDPVTDIRFWVSGQLWAGDPHITLIGIP